MPLSEMETVVAPLDLDQPNLGQIHPELASRLIGRIFAVGLDLAALQALLGDGALSERAAGLLKDLDTIIRDVRAAVFGLSTWSEESPSVAARSRVTKPPDPLQIAKADGPP